MTCYKLFLLLKEQCYSLRSNASWNPTNATCSIFKGREGLMFHYYKKTWGVCVVV